MVERPYVNTVENRGKIYETPGYQDELVEIYYKLCDERDATYKETVDLEKQLALASAKVIAAQAEEAALAKRIELVWGPNWLVLKKEIGQIAQSFQRIPARK